MTEKNQKSRAPLYLTLLAIGVFLIGAALIPLFIRVQESALEGSGIIRPPVVMNQMIPKLELTDLQGKPVSLAGTAGKVVLVNNWATWCPPCVSEMPELQAYYLAHVNQGFDLVAIASEDSPAVVAGFVKQHGLTFQVWLDPGGAAQGTFQNWDFPNSYVADRQGILRMSWTGSVNREILEKYVTPLLDETSK